MLKQRWWICDDWYGEIIAGPFESKEKARLTLESLWKIDISYPYFGIVMARTKLGACLK